LLGLIAKLNINSRVMIKLIKGIKMEFIVWYEDANGIIRYLKENVFPRKGGSS
jgi:hypothetical protein